jgi:HEAT repeat protein
MSTFFCADDEPSVEQARWTAAHLLWDVAGAADPHLNRNLAATLAVGTMGCGEARAVLSAVLSAFEWLGEEEPAAVMRFLGTLLNAVEPPQVQPDS